MNLLKTILSKLNVVESIRRAERKRIIEDLTSSVIQCHLYLSHEHPRVVVGMEYLWARMAYEWDVDTYNEFARGSSQNPYKLAPLCSIFVLMQKLSK